jgi:energy-coupling factor transporter ATP-binding protein EcfA2
MILLTGHAGAGKDTTCAILKELIPNSVSFALADLLKVMTFKILKYMEVPIGGVNDLYDVATKNNYRRYLQHFGEICREVFGTDFWPSMVIKKVKTLYPNQVVIITDIRYKDDMSSFKQFDKNALSIKIISKVYEYKLNSSHPSETEIDECTCDEVVENNGTMDELRNHLRDVCERRGLIAPAKIVERVERVDPPNVTTPVDPPNVTTPVDPPKVVVERVERVDPPKVVVERVERVDPPKVTTPVVLPNVVERVVTSFLEQYAEEHSDFNWNDTATLCKLAQQHIKQSMDIKVLPIKVLHVVREVVRKFTSEKMVRPTPVDLPNVTTPVDLPNVTTPVDLPNVTTPVDLPKDVIERVDPPNVTTPVDLPKDVIERVDPPNVTTPVDLPNVTTPVDPQPPKQTSGLSKTDIDTLDQQPTSFSNKQLGKMGEDYVANLIRTVKPEYEVIMVSSTGHVGDIHVIDHNNSIKYMFEVKFKQVITKQDVIKFENDLLNLKTDKSVKIIGVFISTSSATIISIGELSVTSERIYLTQKYCNEESMRLLFNLFETYIGKSQPLLPQNQQNQIVKYEVSKNTYTLLAQIQSEYSSINAEREIYNSMLAQTTSISNSIASLHARINIREQFFNYINNEFKDVLPHVKQTIEVSDEDKLRHFIKVTPKTKVTKKELLARFPSLVSTLSSMKIDDIKTKYSAPAQTSHTPNTTE